MPYFLHTVETAPDGIGFSHFGAVHFAWLLVGAVVILLNCIWYRKMQAEGRRRWAVVIAGLTVADELFKVVMLIIGGRYTPDYLPLHLCSINIFIILLHAWKPNDLFGGFLYTVCIPGAMAALLFPTWTALPLGNFMHLHSFTIHILLMMYPVVLTVGGDIYPSLKKLPMYILLLFAMAIAVYVVNVILDTNFMFLMYAEAGNPLYLFEQLWGNHFYGFPVIMAGVLFVMFLPLVLYRRKKGLPL